MRQRAKIELLYFPGCPHVEEARAALRRHNLDFREIDTTAEGAPIDLRNWASPTILIDGVDLAGEKPGGGPSCRVYPPGFSFDGALDAITSSKRRWASPIALLGGAIVSLLPIAACPACLGGYAALIASLGASALLQERVLLPLTILFLVIGIATVGWATRRHRNFLPLVVTVGGAALIVGERLSAGGAVMRYSGALLLLLGAVLNHIVERTYVRTACCVQTR